jgi:hypothetical protein
MELHMDGCKTYLSNRDRELTSGPLSFHLDDVFTYDIGCDLPGHSEAGMVAGLDDILDAVVGPISPLYARAQRSSGKLCDCCSIYSILWDAEIILSCFFSLTALFVSDSAHGVRWFVGGRLSCMKGEPRLTTLFSYFVSGTVVGICVT